jgi:drug/metabolite transporter (DMT)-like permease
MGRVTISIVFMLAAIVCGYLFVAGFEQKGVTVWKVVTCLLSVLFVALALTIARKGQPQ